MTDDDDEKDDRGGGGGDSGGEKDDDDDDEEEEDNDKGWEGNSGHHSYMHVQIGKRAARACFLGMMTTKANSPSAPPPVHPPTHAPTKPAGWPAGPHKARIVRNATANSPVKYRAW